MIVALIGRAQETVAPLYAERGHTLSVRLPGEPLDLRVDPLRMIRVLASVLNNAAESTPPCGQVTVTAGREGEWIATRVRDSGRGMSSDLSTRIFEPFFQLPRAIGRKAASRWFAAWSSSTAARRRRSVRGSASAPISLPAG